MNLKSGTVVVSPFWPEPVEIKLIEESGDYVHIVGVTTKSNQHVDQIISKKELANFEVLGTEIRCDEEPWKVFLGLETIRYRFATLYDPLLAMNTSKVDPLPHQIEAVYGYVLKLPRIRFLIADDPGAGKTIMAGLIIKELKLRNLAKKILIVVPGHLKDQWRRELSERFEEKFMVMDRGLLDALYGENAWLREKQIITSIDFAKQEDVLPSIASARYDLIIVDEAHKMSAYKYGDKISKTSRYKLGEALSRNTEHLLFLTATPHKGDPENFRLFLDLLERGFFSTNELLNDSVKNKDNPLFIRRIKEDLKDFEGKPIFLPRYVRTKAFRWKTDSPNEQILYNELSKYVQNQYNKALTKTKRRNVAFALVILQRRLASSTYALWKSLERRKKRLEEMLETVDKPGKLMEKEFDFDTVEDMSEEERWKEEEIWETLSVAENREELEKEIQTLIGLITKAKKIIQNEEELKLLEFKNALQELVQNYAERKDKKVLVFTESKETLEYLEKKIRSWGYSTNTIHGGMKLDERIKAETIFKNETDVLVATEAAGEGINLQFCHLMINYDIPWNPNRLEQRMGRIHRYGQQKEVHIFNLVAIDSREGQVLYRLFEKIDEIRDAMGSDKVFDVLSEVLYDKNLSQLLMEAAASSRDINEIVNEVDITVDDEYIAQIKENLGESLATRFIDYTRIKEMAQQAKEYRLIPEYTESYFKKAFAKVGGRFRKLSGSEQSPWKEGLISVDSIPYDIRKIADEDTFIKTHGELLKRYMRCTFDKEIAFKNPDMEFVTFGHPLFEAVMDWVDANFNDSLLNGATFIDPDGKLNGYILFFEGEIKDGMGDVAGKRLFSFLISDNDITTVSPAIIWDLSENDSEEIIPNEVSGIDIDALKKKGFNAIIPQLESYKSELFQERQRQAHIHHKYGVKSLDDLVVNLDAELIKLYERKEMGENVDLAIRNKQERMSEYQRALQELKELIEMEQSLTMSAPKFRGILRVIPAKKKSIAMVSDEMIERIGMEVAINYEEENKRTAEDVSSENLGFDIRSVDINKNIRYIEVKARAGMDAIALTQNEWFKARRFKNDYYLYAVLNVAESPQLYIIPNPAENLKPDEKIEMVRYIIDVRQIVQIGAEND